MHLSRLQIFRYIVQTGLPPYILCSHYPFAGTLLQFAHYCQRNIVFGLNTASQLCVHPATEDIPWCSFPQRIMSSGDGRGEHVMPPSTVQTQEPPTPGDETGQSL